MTAMSHANASSATAAGYADASDKRLVEQTLAGNKDAFAVLHKRYYQRVYRLALVRCRTAQDAEDVASETFVRAITHLSGYRFQSESLLPWLLRIAANLAADTGRKVAQQGFVSLDSGPGTSAGDAVNGVRSYLETIESDGPDPHTLAARRETQALLKAAILALPPDQSEAVLLRFGADLPLKEIAQTMNKTEGAIKSLLHRALVGLRRGLVGGQHEAAIFGHVAGHVAPTTTAHGDTVTAARQVAPPEW